MSLSEFRRGRRCEHCSKQRASKTNLEKYSVENVFQSEEIKQHIKDTNLKKTRRRPSYESKRNITKNNGY